MTARYNSIIPPISPLQLENTYEERESMKAALLT